MDYISNTEVDERSMLESNAVSDFDELLREIPRAVRLGKELNLPHPLSEMELQRRMEAFASENLSQSDYASFLGAGVYDHFIPAIISHLLSRSEFYTAYTPYQAEVSQGTLQAIYEYQTMICQLTGMDISNASLYDGGSAVAEASLMAHHFNRKKRIVLSGALHPHYREVTRTYLQGASVEIAECPPEEGMTDYLRLCAMCDDDTSCVVVQSPNFFGLIENPTALDECLERFPHIIFIMVVHPISLGILKPPGDFGAHIAVGEGQPLGNAQYYGGPHFGFLACQEKFKRVVPGRLVSATADLEGQRGFVLTLQTREQHIRREKATSNICTNQALNALAAAIYMSTMGRSGFGEVARQCLQKAHYLADRCEEIPGVSLAFSGPFFNEFVLNLPHAPADQEKAFRRERIFPGIPLDGYFPGMKNSLLVAVTEKRTRDEMDRYVEILRSEVETVSFDKR